MDKPHNKATSESQPRATIIRAKTLPARSTTQFSWRSLIIPIFAWTMAAWFLLALLDHYEIIRLSSPQSLHRIQTLNTVLDPCESLPPHGSVLMMDPSVMNRTDVRYSGLEIQNNYNYPMVAILSDPAGSRQLLALFISPENTIQISVPIGQYGMQVWVGSMWCNLKTGFSDGAQVSVTGEISIASGITSQMQFYGSGLAPLQLALAYHQVDPAEYEKTGASEITALGQLELKQTRDGHYFSSGTINGSPVVFMIDTGATLVAISAEMAAQADIQHCTPHVVITANGKAQGCVAIAAEISFGSFKLTNVAVSILPGMPGDALLGMNVLRNFHIEQIDNTMRISAR